MKFIGINLYVAKLEILNETECKFANVERNKRKLYYEID